MKGKQSYLKHIAVLVLAVIAVNLLSNYAYERFDLTQDKRFTLTKSSEQVIKSARYPLYVDVFLEGDFPSEFNKLKLETQQLLEQYQDHNDYLKFEFLNGAEAMAQAENRFNAAAQEFNQTKELFQQQKISEEEWKVTVDNYNREGQNFSFLKEGLKPAKIQVRENGKVTNALVYPWAVAYYENESVIIPLLKNNLGATTEERVASSIQNLEYAFTDGFNKLINPKSKRVAILKGNGEVEDRYLADFLGTLRERYFIAPFTLDSVAITPQRTLEQLNTFDLAIIASPTKAFTEEEKYTIDQYVHQGGASLWLLEGTKEAVDSTSGKTYRIPQDLNLNDQLFKYGIRINTNLINDLYAAPIVLASGDGNDARYEKFPWFYYPLSSSGSVHPIVNNLEGVKFEYASAIDTLPNMLNKTVLLSSSPITRLVGTPVAIDFDKQIPENLKIVNEGPKDGVFNAGETPLAVLLEGEFPSFFENRVKPFKISEKKGKAGKMIVISDGDIIKNQFDKNRPLELGFDKLANTFYGNKEFLLNSVNYLLDETGLINIRTKEIAIPFLDSQKAIQERTQWQLLNTLLPLGLLAIFAVTFIFYRKRKYQR